MRLVAEGVGMRLREPLRASWGTLSERQLLRVRLVAEDGLEGLGDRKSVV